MKKIEAHEKRPDVLTVFCIMSFIGLGWRIFRSLLDAVAGLFTPNVSSVLDEVISDLESEGDAATAFAKEIVAAVQHLMDHISSIALMKIVFSILALIGVLMIWNLRRPGFYMYAIFRILILLTPVIVLGMNILSLFAVASGTVFAALFIIVYGVHLKYLK